MQSEVMAGIEITTRRIEAQVTDKERLLTESTRHEAEVAKEHEKNAKLVDIAEKKYKMELAKVDFYLPKGKDHEAKLRQVEQKLVKESRDETQKYKTEVKNEDAKIMNLKRSVTDTKDKLDALKFRLRTKAMEAQRLVEKANEMGDFAKALQIQEQNYKVFSLLNMSMDDVKGNKRMLRAKKTSTESVKRSDYSSGTFLTSSHN